MRVRSNAMGARDGGGGWGARFGGKVLAVGMVNKPHANRVEHVVLRCILKWVVGNDEGAAPKAIARRVLVVPLAPRGLKQMFGDDQEGCLADYLEVALQSRYNKRSVG